MSFCYQVILKPSDVKFTASKIPSHFDNGASLESIAADIKNGRKDLADIDVIEVVWYADKWEWYTLSNQLLWVFRELEKAENVSYVSMNRVEYVDDYEEKLPADLFDFAELEAVDTRRVRSRSSSICSSSSEGRGKDNWGRRGASTSPSPRSHSGERATSRKDNHASKKKKSKMDVHVHDNDDTDDEEEESHADTESAILEWVEGRKKFCTLYSKDYNFQEYVAQNFTMQSSLMLQPASSLVSLDSNFTASSIISREQRHIDPLSGYHGYGHFDDYSKNYLSKLREERNALRRRLKPYDVSSSSCPKERSRRSSFSSYDDGDLDYPVRKRITIKEERITRTYSESIDYRYRSHYRRRENPRESRSNEDLRKSIKRGRSYSEGENYRDARSLSTRRQRRVSHTGTISRRPLHGSYTGLRSDHDGWREGSRRSLDSSLRSYGSLKKRSLSRNSLYGSHSSLRSGSSSFALRLSSVPREKLYEIWQRRREKYLQARYGATKALEYGCNSLAVTGYTCGLCFKSFQTRVRREQHSEELLHWACITCGRFFASHTALGQHVEQAGHRKD